MRRRRVRPTRAASTPGTSVRRVEGRELRRARFRRRRARARRGGCAGHARRRRRHAADASSPIPRMALGELARAVRAQRRRARRRHHRLATARRRVKTMLGIDPRAARPHACQRRQPQQRNRPAADLARCAGRRAIRGLEMGAGKPGDIAYLAAHRAAGNRIGEQHRAGASRAHGHAATASPRRRARSMQRCPPTASR